MSDAASPDKLIAIVVKNAREQIRISIRPRQDGGHVDIRLFVENPDRIPSHTKTGIGIRLSLLRDVIEGLQQAEAAAKKEGLI